MSERAFADGQFVWFWPKLEEVPVVARVITRRGSGFHVSWVSLGGNEFGYVADPDELISVGEPPRGMKNPRLPPQAFVPPVPELRELNVRPAAAEEETPTHTEPEARGRRRR